MNASKTAPSHITLLITSVSFTATVPIMSVSECYLQIFKLLAVDPTQSVVITTISTCAKQGSRACEALKAPAEPTTEH